MKQVPNEKLDEPHKTLEKVIETKNTLMKVVESVSTAKKLKSAASQKKISWNMHCTYKKGQNIKSKEACNSVFQEEQRRPPGQESEGWVESTRRTNKKWMQGSTLEKGIQELKRFLRKEGKMKAQT